MHKKRNSAAASHTFPSKIATTKQKQQQQQRIKFLLEMRPKQELKVDPELYKAAAPRRCKKMPRGTFKLFDWNLNWLRPGQKGGFVLNATKCLMANPTNPTRQNKWRKLRYKCIQEPRTDNSIPLIHLTSYSWLIQHHVC